MKSILRLVALLLSLVCTPSWSGALECTKLADEKKLSAAPRKSFLRKCEADAGGGVLAACESEAAAKKLTGSQRNLHMKKCLAEKTKLG